jgi:hypothetical protein
LYDGANFVDYFNGVFAENATLSVDPLPAISMTRGFVDDSNQLLPWWNDFLEVAIIREFHGTTGYVEIWQVLGRSLTRKLDFFSTIVNENDGTVLFPDDLEPLFDEQGARIRGMILAALT